MPKIKSTPALAKGRHLFGSAKVGEKGQIVIPKEARELFGIKPGDTLLILGDERAGIIVTKPDVLNKAANNVFRGLEKQSNADESTVKK